MSEFQPPDGLNTEEAAELANVLPPTLEEAYAEGRDDERAAAIAHFEKTARDTDDQSQFGKAFWCRAAAQALRNGWHLC